MDAAVAVLKNRHFMGSLPYRTIHATTQRSQSGEKVARCRHHRALRAERFFFRFLLTRRRITWRRRRSLEKRLNRRLRVRWNVDLHYSSPSGVKGLPLKKAKPIVQESEGSPSVSKIERGRFVSGGASAGHM
jgi:hypothetical protein